MIISKLYLNIFIILGLLPSFSVAQSIDSMVISSPVDSSIYQMVEDSLKIAPPENQNFEYKKSKRFVAALLCLTLGPFGMHRLYLGTTPQVAATYSVTLGGAAVLPIIDLLLITFSKDLSRFKNNPHVLMWGK